jgi:hypothetical protein
VKKRKSKEPQSNEQAYKRLLSILATLPQKAVHDVLRRFRSGEDVQSLLRHIENADLLVQVTLIPEVRLRYDFPYLRQMPPSLMIPENQYLRSYVYEAVVHGEVIPPAAILARSVQQAQSPYTMPYHAASIVEPILSKITARPWTVVNVADDMVRTLLEGYFVHHYPYLPQFHKGLFLEAMANGQYNLCSSLLVNAVLAAACVRRLFLPSVSIADFLVNRASTA